MWCDDCLVDFAYQKSFQAAHRLFFGFAFCGASVDVGDGGFVESHADHEDAVQGCVGLPVAASVESVT